MGESARDNLERIIQRAVAKSHWLNLDKPDTIKADEVEVHWMDPEKSNTTDDVGFHILFSYDLEEALAKPKLCKSRISSIRKEVKAAIAESKLLPRGGYGVWARPQIGASYESFTIT